MNPQDWAKIIHQQCIGARNAEEVKSIIAQRIEMAQEEARRSERERIADLVEQANPDKRRSISLVLLELAGNIRSNHG